MRRNIIYIIAVCFLTVPLAAQTLGVSGVNDYTINGTGSGAASCVTSIQDGNAPVHVKVTTLPGTPVAFAVADFCSLGAYVIDPTYSVDIDLASLSIVAAGAGPFAALFTAGPGGTWEIYTAPLGTGSLVSQVGLVNPAFATGVITTQAHDTTFCPQVTAGPTSDDGNVLFPLCGFTFNFYGTAWTDVYVNSNGILTFGASDSDFSPSESEFNADVPRIAPCWSDVSPNIGGSITITETGAGVAVDYVDVPAYSTPGDISTFGAFLYPNGDIDLTWGGLNPSASTDVVGIGPGGGAIGAEIDLSGIGAYAGMAGEPIYEVFTDSGCGDSIVDLTGGSGSFVYDGVSAYTYTGSGFSTTVGGISPTNGWDTGGDTVTVTGAGFNSANVYDVSFGGTSVPATWVDGCTLTCVSPAGTLGPVDVEVFENSTSIALLSGAWTYTLTGTYQGTFSLGDDSSVQYFFQSTVDGDFSFYGVTYTSIFINSNGNITLGFSDSDFSESEGEMLSDEPRIAPHWDDMHPGLGGTVSYFEDDTTVVITFTDVPAYTTGANSSTTVLNKVDGTISITHGGDNTSWNGSVSTNSVLVGISPGGGATLDPVDLSAASGFVGAPGLALFEWFNTSSFSGGLVPYDLPFRTVTFVYDTLTNGYTVTTGGPTFSGSFSLSDDGNIEYVFQSPIDADFDFYGVTYTSVFVNANGNLTFGSGDSDFSESESEMLSDQPRIAMHWEDMNPTSNPGGSITYFEDDTTVVITFTDIAAYTTGSNSSVTTLDKVTGNVTITQGPSNTSWNGVVSSRGVITGLSAGGGLGTLTPVDLSTAVGVVGGANQALFEYYNTSTFSGGLVPWDLDGLTTLFTYDGISGYTVN